MLAYERAGKWQEAVGVLQRAESLGLAPNTVMLNTAISAAGKAGQLEVAEGLFEHAMLPDAITYEAFIAACGIAGAPEKVSGGFLYWWLAVWGMLCYVMHTHTHTHTRTHTLHICTQAEKALQLMRAQGFRPREYAFCGLIAAYSLAGMHEAALKVRMRARREGLQVCVCMFVFAVASSRNERGYAGWHSVDANAHPG